MIEFVSQETVNARVSSVLRFRVASSVASVGYGLPLSSDSDEAPENNDVALGASNTGLTFMLLVTFTLVFIFLSMLMYDVHVHVHVHAHIYVCAHVHVHINVNLHVVLCSC